MFMYCGVVWGIGWVLHVYVLWSGVGHRMGVTYMFMYCGCGVGHRMGVTCLCIVV